MWYDLPPMANTNRTPDTVYLDPDQFAALKALAERTRIPKSTLYREAVEDLLIKHGATKAPKGGKPK
jgi:predicted transcriptional regulator